jgi:hypothetical protein
VVSVSTLEASEAVRRDDEVFVESKENRRRGVFLGAGSPFGAIQGKSRGI